MDYGLLGLIAAIVVPILVLIVTPWYLNWDATRSANRARKRIATLRGDLNGVLMDSESPSMMIAKFLIDAMFVTLFVGFAILLKVIDTS